MTELILKSAPPLRLVKVSFNYDRVEDRICLNGASASDERLRLWLTSRLLNRLLPYLIRKQMAFHEMQGSSGGATLTSSDKNEAGDESVICGPEHPEALVTEVGLNFQEHHIVLTFKVSAKESAAVFALSFHTLEKWNRGFQQCYQQAQWPQHAFQAEVVANLQAEDSVTIH